MAADSVIMGQCRRTVPWLMKMHGLKSLMLRRRSLLMDRDDAAESTFAKKGGW